MDTSQYLPMPTQFRRFVLNTLRHVSSALFILHIAYPLAANADSDVVSQNDNGIAVQERLGQLSLKDAERLFSENNRELLFAKRQVQGAEADKITAGQRPNPTLTLSSTNFHLHGNNGRGGLDNKTLDSIARIDQLIERGNKRELREAAAGEAIQANQYALKDTVRQEKLILQQSYYDLLLAQEKLTVQQNNVELYDRLLQAARLRLKAGDVAQTDVARINVDAMRAQNDLRQAQADMEKAQAVLAYLTGQERQADKIRAIDSWPDLGGSDDHNAYRDIPEFMDADASVIAQRPDVLAADARIRQAQDNRRLAEALTTRDISVGVQYEHYPEDSRNTVGAAVSIPLFTRYQYQGEIARAQVDYDTALDAEEAAKARALGEIAAARADLKAAIDKLRKYDQHMLSEAQRSADAAEFAYKNGAMDVTDLLDARRVLRTIQLDAATVRADYAKSLAAWQAAVHPEENQ